MLPFSPHLLVGGLRPLCPPTHDPLSFLVGLHKKRTKRKKPCHPLPVELRKKRNKRKKLLSLHEPPPLGGPSPSLLGGLGRPALSQQGHQGTLDIVTLGVVAEEVVDLGPRQPGICGLL
jgi:hypothetical protein